MSFTKFPNLVADDTTNEQKILEWRKKTAKTLQERITKLEKMHTQYWSGKRKAYEEVLEALQ